MWTSRRLVPLWLALVCLVGCSGGPNGQAGAARDRPLVLTTFTVLADIARNVAGEHLEIESITKPGAEIHGYEPTPRDIAKATDADLILDNGLNLELWFQKFVQEADIPHVVVSEGIEPIGISEDAYAGKPNPHAWMSPLNVQIYADNMADAFAALDPDNAADYRENAASYKARLQAVHDALVSELESLRPSERALVTCEGAFSYLARDAGLKEVYLWPVNAEEQSTPQRVAKVVDFVRTTDVKAVFCESTVSDKAMQQVVSATGATFGGTLYVDSLSGADGPVPTYLDLIAYDARAISNGLSGGQP